MNPYFYLALFIIGCLMFYIGNEFIAKNQALYSGTRKPEDNIQVDPVQTVLSYLVYFGIFLAILGLAGASNTAQRVNCDASLLNHHKPKHEYGG